MKYDIVFWINDVNLHLASFISSLSEKKNILVIAQKEKSKERVLEGWYVPSLGKSDLIIAPSDHLVKSCVDVNRNAIHVFLGINGFSLVYKGFKYATAKKVRIGIISESGINIGVIGKLRKVRFIVNRIRYGDDIDFVLAMGYLGVKWFNDAYFQKEKLFPFLYTVPYDDFLINKTEKPIRDGVNLIVIAQCIKRKNLDLLFRALSNLKEFKWHLTIIGEGHLKKKLIGLTKELEIDCNVRFLGAIPYNEVKTYFNASDLSILPSKWDGWGAVVNESLMAGIPIICSDTCGASCLIDGINRGEIFRSDSIASLQNILRFWLSKGEVEDNKRENIMQWSKCLSGELVSEYFVNVLDYVYSDKTTPKPVEPWLL
jgi:glycosyltransferase involved in cell wall biosynthesis